MSTPMSARERVLITFSVCLTVLVAAPLTALAATGQLVNIVDPSNAARKARVNSIGALQVQTRPGIRNDAFNASREGDGGWAYLFTNASTTKTTAILEVTAAARNGGTEPTPGSTWVRLRSYTVNTGTSCTTLPEGGTYIQLRAFVLAHPGTVQLSFAGQPIFVSPPATGKIQCFGLLYTPLEELGIFTGAMTGYTFVP